MTAKLRRPTIGKGPASNYAGSLETIREISNGQNGCLISLRTLDDGGLVVELYRCDPGVRWRLASRRKGLAKAPPTGCRQTACRHCGLDIEGLAPYRKGEWRDRGNNRTCPHGPNQGKAHAPTI